MKTESALTFKVQQSVCGLLNDVFSLSSFPALNVSEQLSPEFMNINDGVQAADESHYSCRGKCRSQHKWCCTFIKSLSRDVAGRAELGRAGPVQ